MAGSIARSQFYFCSVLTHPVMCCRSTDKLPSHLSAHRDKRINCNESRWVSVCIIYHVIVIYLQEIINIVRMCAPPPSPSPPATTWVVIIFQWPYLLIESVYVDLFRMTLNSLSRAHEFHYHRPIHSLCGLICDEMRSIEHRFESWQNLAKINGNRNSNALKWNHVQITSNVSNGCAMKWQQVSCRIDCFSLFGGDFNLIYIPGNKKLT